MSTFATKLNITIILLTALFASLLVYTNIPREPTTTVDFKTTKNEYRLGETLSVTSTTITHINGTFGTKLSVRCANGRVSYSILDVKEIAVTKNTEPVHVPEVTIGRVPYEIEEILDPDTKRVECRVVADSIYQVELMFGLTQEVRKISTTPFFIVVKE